MGHAQIWAFTARTPLGSDRFLKVLYPTNYHATFGTSITKMHNSALRDQTNSEGHDESKQTTVVEEENENE